MGCRLGRLLLTGCAVGAIAAVGGVLFAQRQADGLHLAVAGDGDGFFWQTRSFSLYACSNQISLRAGYSFFKVHEGVLCKPFI